MSVSVKICGLTDEAALHAAVEAGADYAGFVHYSPSPRHLDIPRMAALSALLPLSARSVVVLVDPSDALLQEIAAAFIPDFVQLHGKETPARILEIRERFGYGIIRSVSVGSGDDIAQAKTYEACSDILLFDAKPPSLPGMLPGGNALSFDWALLKGREFSKPWMLSGGLNAENITDAIRISGARMVDVSSGVECAPGKKDVSLIRAFVNRAKDRV